MSVAGRKTCVWELVGARRDELHKTSARAVNRFFYIVSGRLAVAVLKGLFHGTEKIMYFLWRRAQKKTRTVEARRDTTKTSAKKNTVV